MMNFVRVFISLVLMLMLTSIQFNPLTLQTQFDLEGGDGTFVSGTPLKINYQVENKTGQTLKAYVAGSVSSVQGTVLHSFKKYIEIPNQQSQTFTFYYSPPKANVYHIYAHVRNTKGTLKANTIKLAYAPLEIASPLTRKQDFMQFWQSTLKTLQNTAPSFKMIAKPSLNSADYEVFLVEMQSLENTTVRAWYRRPKGKNQVPVVLQLPSLGGGFYNVGSLEDKPKHGVPLDFAVLSLNIRGHGNSKEYLDVGEDYHQIVSHRLESKETYFYRGAIADCIRALDFIATRPEIDQRKIAVEGASQGGALSLFTAALDERVDLCAPDVPFLSDIENLLTLTNWVADEVSRYQKKQPTLTSWRVQYNLSYFDTKNFAPLIQVPVLMSLGLQDHTCPALTGFATYNRINAPKRLYVYPLAGHQGGGAAHRQKKFQWIRAEWGL